MQDEEEHFEFVDRRRTAGSSGEGQGQDQQPQPAKEEPGKEDTEDRGKHPRLAAADRLLMCLDILHQGAWIALGLVEDPVTEKVEKNLPEAKALIDAVAALVDVVGSFVEDRDRRELQNLVATLRMNFVNQSRRP